MTVRRSLIRRSRNPQSGLSSWDERIESLPLSIPVLIGLVLVAVPTGFTVFPRWASWPLALRVIVLACWLGVAGSGVAITARTDSRVRETVTKEREATIRDERRSALTAHFQSIFRSTVTGLPPQYEYTVYVPVEEYLVPVYPRIFDVADPAIFQAGKGATGRAWEHEQHVFAAHGPSVYTDEFGLTREQRRRFDSFEAVAATVILDERGHRIGVLTAISREDDRTFDRDQSGFGFSRLKSLADNLSHLIPQAKKWMLPHPDEDDAFRPARQPPPTSVPFGSSFDGDNSPGRDLYQSYAESSTERTERLEARKEHLERARNVAGALQRDFDHRDAQE